MYVCIYVYLSVRYDLENDWTGSTLKDGLYFNMDFVKISSEYALTKQEIFRDTGDKTFDENLIYHVRNSVNTEDLNNRE